VGTYFLRRLGLAAVLLWVVATVLFFSIHLLPGDPALLILGGDAAQASPEQIARVILFLVGPDARIISGATIPVYGRA